MRPVNNRLLVVSTGVGLFILACSLPTDACGCPPALGIGTLAGVVTDGASSTVANTEVRVEARIFGCQASPANGSLSPSLTRTDAAGRYRIGIQAIAPTDTACIRVVARRPRTDGTGTDSVVVAGLRMRLVANYGTKVRPDSVRIDLRLP